MSNIGSAYVDELGNKAVYGNFTNLTESQFVNDGRLYLFGNISNNGYYGDGFGYEYIKTCDSSRTIIEGTGQTEFNILDVNNTGGVDLKQKIWIKANLQFSNGIISTSRLNPGDQVFFMEGASHLAAGNTKHVNGTVSKQGAEPFVFPLGDGDHLAQLKVRGQNPFDIFTASYYSLNLNFFDWTSPGSFPRDSVDFNVLRVQSQEFWTLDGAQSTEITLYWSSYSKIDSLTTNINDLIIVGWDGEKWVNLGQTKVIQVFTTGTLTSSSIIPNGYQAYTFGVLDTDGDGIPDSEDDDPFDPCVPDATVDACQNRYCADLITGVFLEGALQTGGIGNYGSEMRTQLEEFGYLPGQEPKTLLGIATDPGQPYRVDPWFYNGAEGQNINEINPTTNPQSYPANVVDWVLVSLRATPEPSSVVCQKAALVLTDGQVVMTDFFNCCGLVKNSYYIVIEQRNHLIVMSHEPVLVDNNTFSYDFRTNQSYSVLFGSGQKEVTPGIFAMYAGNGDQILSEESAKDINTNDITLWAKDNGKHSGYFFQDYDLSGDVNVHDKALWLLNNGVFTDVDR